MPVCQHVQLITCISLSLLPTLWDGSLITWCQLYVDLHLLLNTGKDKLSFRKALTYSPPAGQKLL